MDYGKLPLFGLMKAKLDYSSARAGILAQNVANADTPGYRARDVKEPDFKNLVAQGGGLQMTRTSGKHMDAQITGVQTDIIKRPSTYELSPTDNNVVIEEEMQRVAMNQSDYQRTLNLYRKTIGLFKTALGQPSGGA